MALVRVDSAALAAVASQLQPLPQLLAAAHQQIQAARNASSVIGDAGAAADTGELLRQLGWLVEIESEVTAGLVRSLLAASGDYGAADNIVVRFDS